MKILKKGNYFRAYCTEENEGETRFKIDDEMGSISIKTGKFVGATVCLIELNNKLKTFNEKQNTSKIIENDFAYSSEGVDSYSAKVELSSEWVANIEKAKQVLKDNPFLGSVSIDAWGLDITQFDCTLDDEERKEIPYGEIEYFQSDSPYVIIYPSGGVILRAFGKWDCSQYYEMYLSE